MSAGTKTARRAVLRWRVMPAVMILVAAGLGSAQVAQAAPAVIDVPCSATALAGDISSASSGEALNLASRCMYVLTKGLPVVTDDLAIVGNGASLVRSYAPGTAAFTILTVDSGNLTISMLNFRNGNGAILVADDGQLTVNGGIFTGNTGAAAIDSDNEDYSPQVNGAAFIRNTAGAISNYSDSSSVEVSSCTFIRNTGPAIWEYGWGGTISGSTFSGNTGGALYLDENFNEMVSGDVFDGNSTTGDGGAILNNGDSGEGVTIEDSKFYGNHAGGQGGALYAFGPSTSFMTGTDIEGNSATDGGGIEADSIVVSNSTISGNRASEDGGGIGDDSQWADLIFTGSTISGNRAGIYGGGLYNRGWAQAAGTQIVSNKALGGGGGIYDDGAYATVSLTTSTVLNNKPDNCEPANSITGCTNVSQGPTGPIVSGYHKTVCVDARNDSSANDTKIVMWDCNGTAGQNWAIDADGTIQINGKCMDIYRDEKRNKAPVELWTCTGGANQRWEARNGTLVNPVSGKCLDDPRFNTADGTQLQVYTCNGGRNQQWKLP